MSRFLRLIRFSHTIFALPFALGALVVAANGWPSLKVLLLVVVCMVFARTAAMLFNRLVDWSLDQRNPRTASRHLLVSKRAVQVFLVLSSAGFVVAASAINRLTFILAPVALALVFFYSVTKRFTSATHFFLGLALAVAPVGAWIAQTGRIDLAPVVLGAGVICWVAGFDLIYATQDYDFDRRADRFRSGGETWCALLLVDAVDCGGAVLRAQDRQTRSRRDQSRFLSKQRVCERGVSRGRLRRPINLTEEPNRRKRRHRRGSVFNPKHYLRFLRCLL